MDKWTKLKGILKYSEKEFRMAAYDSTQPMDICLNNYASGVMKVIIEKMEKMEKEEKKEANNG